MSKNNPSVSNHSFNIEYATRYGVDEAIMIGHLIYWIEYNLRLKRNFIEGRTWTYATQKELAAHFPYWSEDQINRLVKKLERLGIIIKGNFNKAKYDRTIWYAFKDEELFIKHNSISPSIPRNRGRVSQHSAKSRNGFHEIAEPIPYSYTDIEEEEGGLESKEIFETKPDLPNTSRLLQDQKPPQRAPAPQKISKEDRDYYNKIKDNELLMWLPDGDKMEAIQCYGWEIVQTVLNSLFDKHLSLREKVMPKKIKNMVGIFYAELNKEERRRNQW